MISLNRTHWFSPASERIHSYLADCTKPRHLYAECPRLVQLEQQSSGEQTFDVRGPAESFRGCTQSHLLLFSFLFFCPPASSVSSSDFSGMMWFKKSDFLMIYCCETVGCKHPFNVGIRQLQPNNTVDDSMDKADQHDNTELYEYLLYLNQWFSKFVHHVPQVSPIIDVKKIVSYQTSCKVPAPKHTHIIKHHEQSYTNKWHIL